MNRQINDLDIYIRPRPEVVARIWDDPNYGAHAAMERWFWVGHSTLAKIAMEGRVILRRQAGIVGRSSAARSTTPEQEDALVEAVHRLASIPAAVRETGTPRIVIARVLRERGISPPSVDQRAVALAARERRRAA